MYSLGTNFSIFPNRFAVSGFVYAVPGYLILVQIYSIITCYYFSCFVLLHSNFLHCYDSGSIGASKSMSIQKVSGAHTSIRVLALISGPKGLFEEGRPICNRALSSQVKPGLHLPSTSVKPDGTVLRTLPQVLTHNICNSGP